MHLGKNISLKLFYSYVDGNVKTKIGGKDTTFFNLIRRPKSTFGLTLGSNITPLLYISTGVYAAGKRTDITYDAFFNQVEVALNSYVLWNAYADYAIMKKKIKFFADFHNITNAHFTEAYGFNTMGFNVSAGVRFYF